MKRRVIKQGHNTLTITLPSVWSKKYNVAPGDELDIEEQGKSLLVHAEKGADMPRRAIVDVRGLPVPLIWRYVSSAYRSGYDEIKIMFDESKTMKSLYTAFSYNTIDKISHDGNFAPIEAIQALVNRFVGVEIIDQQRNYCIAKELGETTYKEFDNALRRIFLLLLHLSEQMIVSLKKKDLRSLKSVHMVDTNLDRFQDFCLRVLNRKGYVKFQKTPTVYSLIFLLELIGDEYKKIAIHLLEAKGNIDKKMFELFEVQDKQLRRFYELFYGFSKEKTIEIFNEDQMGDRMNKMAFEKISNYEKEVLHHLKKIGIYVRSLTELRIDMEY